MKSTHKLMLIALAAGELLIAAPVWAAGPAPVVRLETMTIVGKRTHASPAAASRAPLGERAAPAPVVTLEPLVVIGHRDIASARLARLGNASPALRPTPL